MKKLFQLLKANAAEQHTPIQAKTEADQTTVYMYDVIDSEYGINAREFAQALAPVIELSARAESRTELLEAAHIVTVGAFGPGVK